MTTPFTADNNVAYRSLRTAGAHGAAGRPIRQVPGGYPRAKHAVQTTSESATAIAVSYSGVLHARKPTRRKLTGFGKSPPMEISLVAVDTWLSVTCKNDANCDYQSGDGRAKDAKLSAPSSPPPDGTLYIAPGEHLDPAVSKNKPSLNPMNFYGCLRLIEALHLHINCTHQYNALVRCHRRLPVQLQLQQR